MTYLYSDSIVKPLFLDPITSLGANKLCILAEHASPNMASWLLKTYEEKKIYNISIEILYLIFDYLHKHETLKYFEV